MRTIKFRGLRNDGRGLVCGDLLHLEKDFKKVYKILHWETEEASNEVIPESVGQFTGLYDKYGKEIYDGDIIGDWVEVDGKMEQSKQTVFFHEEEGQWMLDNSLNQDRTHFFSLAQELRDFEYEIIGNIHENPELLKQ